MNHRFLTIPFMALCLASCSGSGQDDPNIPTPPAPNPDLVSIDFGGNSGAWQDAPDSRATDSKGLETLFKSFRVWGYKTTNNTPQIVMDGYNVNYTENTAGSTTSNAADWEYVGIKNQTIKYWDYSASDYRFFAYAPADDANIKSSTDDNSCHSPSPILTQKTQPQKLPHTSVTSGTQTILPMKINMARR